jgi:hypothetical protein
VSDEIVVGKGSAISVIGGIIAVAVYAATVSSVADRALEVALVARSHAERLEARSAVLERQVIDLRSEANELRAWRLARERAAGASSQAEAELDKQLDAIQSSINRLLDLTLRVDRLEAARRRRR